MTRKRHIGSAAAVGGFTAAIALLTGLSGAAADELADLRANQQLLQKRIDQLAQGSVPGSYVPGFGPETRKDIAGTPVTAGSFPRSFLVPGTDTSMRIGGFAEGVVTWYLSGAIPAGALNGQGGVNQTCFNGPGGTCNLAGLPLNNSIAHSRSSQFQISPRGSRLLFDTR